MPALVDSARAWSVAAASLLVGVAATLAALSVIGTFDETTVPTAVERVETQLSTDPSGPAQAAERVAPALVQVDAIGPRGTATATGVVFRSDGHLLTTADAVDEATAVTVTIADGSVLPATIVGVDTDSDVAVLDVDRDGMATAVIGRVSALVPGEQAVTVERAADTASPSVASGWVSAVGLRLDTADGGSLHDMIKAALEIAPTSTSAVLCTPKGTVLGLVTSRQPASSAHLTPTSTSPPTSPSQTSTPGTPAFGSGAPNDQDEEGMSTRYATPIDYAAQLADEIIASGSARHVWLGIVGADLDDAAAAVLGRSGAKLTRVVPDSPAAAAGLEDDDVVLAIDGGTGHLDVLAGGGLACAPGRRRGVGHLRARRHQTSGGGHAHRAGLTVTTVARDVGAGTRQQIRPRPLQPGQRRRAPAPVGGEA